MIFSAALLSSALGVVSAQSHCARFGALRNADIPNPSVFLSPTNAFYSDNVFNFALNFAPSSSAPVVITTSVNNSRLTTRPSALTFSAANFSTPQAVEIIVPNNSDMSPIIGTSPLSLSFLSSNQPYANTSCLPVNSVGDVTVPLTLNSIARGGLAVTSAVSINCGSAFGSIQNPTIPSPYVWISPNSTTYADNTFRFASNFNLTSNVTFSVSTGHSAIAANPATFTITPAQAAAKTPIPVTLTIAPGTPVLSLAFPYNLTVQFTPVGQSFGFQPVSYNVLFNGERNDFGLGGYCWIDCWLW